MRTRIYVPALVLLIMQFSCNSILSRKYNINQRFGFSSRTAYTSFLNDKYSISPTQVLYPDSISQLEFMKEISRSKLVQYYGTFLNDSMEIKKSSFLSENLSCIGRVLREIEINSGTGGHQDVIPNTAFRKHYFRHAVDDTRFRVASNGKLNIILLYGFSMGNYFDEFYKEIFAWYKNRNKKVEIFIISVDPLQNLSK